MAKHKKKRFESVEEVFETYIPDYIKPDLRKTQDERSIQGDSIDIEFTTGLLKDFQENIT